ncbi:hypothetical protein [Amycolatopsis sp. NPDC059657]|uniref:hypothetical protein n=1 Tax=Amycolatopsis sp. NPDC059657 TaxID=3346899 RepID=UPI00366FFA3C
MRQRTREDDVVRIFGWTISANRLTSTEAVRRARNEAAMTASVGTAALPGAGVAASRIHQDEVSLAVTIVRQAQKGQWRRTLRGRTEHQYDTEAFSATLRQRLGAATAVGEPQFAPIFLAEIEMLTQATTDLIEMSTLEVESLAGAGRALVEDLHLRLGHAEAIEHLGQVAVFASTATSQPRLPPPAPTP